MSAPAPKQRKMMPSVSPSGWAYTIATALLALGLVAMGVTLPSLKEAEVVRATSQKQRHVLRTAPEPEPAPELTPPEPESVSASPPPAEPVQHPAPDAAHQPQPAATAQETPTQPQPPHPAPEVPPVAAYSLPRITIVLTGVGLSRSTSEATHALPKEMAAAVTPYSGFAEALLERYRADGRDYLLEAPMEPLDYPITDPGPYALMSTNELVKNLSHLEWSLGRIRQAKGVASPLVEKFTESGAPIQQVIEKLSSDKLPVLISKPGGNTAITALMKDEPELNIRIADAVIDQRIDPAAINDSLQALEIIARKKGHAIGIARPYPVTVQTLKQWAPGLASRGVVLTPFSAAIGAPPQPAQAKP